MLTARSLLTPSRTLSVDFTRVEVPVRQATNDYSDLKAAYTEAASMTAMPNPLFRGTSVLEGE